MADDAAKLYAEATKRGYSFQPKGDGRFKMVPPMGGADPEFVGRITAIKPAFNGYLNTKNPSNLKSTSLMLAATDKNPAGKNRSKIAELNDWINSEMAGFAQSESQQKPTDDVLGQMLGAPRGLEFLNAMMPKSATGKAVGLATLPFAGAEGLVGKALSVAVPTLVGAVTGHESGEGALGGAGQGALAGGLNILPELIPYGANAAKGIATWAKRTARADEMRMADVLATTTKMQSDLPKSWMRLRSGKSTWADVFASKGAQDEAGARIASAQDSIATQMASIYNSVEKAAYQRFEQQTGMPFAQAMKLGQNKAGLVKGSIDMKTFRLARMLDNQLKQLKVAPKQFINTIKQARILGKSAFKDGIAEDVLKDGGSAMSAAESYAEKKKAILDSLEKFDGFAKKLGLQSPGLKQTYETANDEYMKFAAIRDLADEILPKIRAQIPAQQALQDLLRENPRPLETRLGDAFGAVKEAIRRFAPDVENSDVPNALKQSRIWAHGTSRPGISTQVAAVRHPFGKFIGAAPKMIEPFKGSPAAATLGAGLSQTTNKLLSGENENKNASGQ